MIKAVFALVVLGFLCPSLLADEGNYSFYISNHDHCPVRRVVHPIVGKTNFVYDANGKIELVRGEGIAFLIKDCENVTIRNLTIDYERPMVTECRIAAFEGRRTILEYDRAKCPMLVVGGRLFMVGSGYTNETRTCRLFDGRTREQIPQAKDVYLDEGVFKELPDGRLSVDFDFSRCGRGCRIGDVVVFRPRKRDCPAIVVYNSKNVVFEDVVVHDAKGMALIAQRSENVTWRGTGRAEDKTSGVFPRSGGYASTHVDATHFSNVRGRVVVENSYFEGMMDDAINVHSTCLAVTNVSGRTLKCRYMHHQAVGFEVFKPGETLRFINGRKLENGPEVKIAAVDMLNEREVLLTLECDVPKGWGVGDAVENADYQCEAIFRNNIVRHNRARGTLFTTPKRVLVESNLFHKVTGAAILFSGDNYYWYESGACNDVVIRANVFSNCYTSAGGYSKGIISFYPVVRDPQIQEKCYHRNVLIEDNLFSGFDAPLLFALSVENLCWRNNRIEYNSFYNGCEEPPFIVRKCRNISIDGVDRSADTRMDTPLRHEMQLDGALAHHRFSLPSHTEGQLVFLDIEEPVRDVQIWLNGILVGGEVDTPLPRRINLTPAVKATGEENVLEIKGGQPCAVLRLVQTSPIHVGFKGVETFARKNADGTVEVFATVDVKGPLPFVKSLKTDAKVWGGEVKVENRVLGENGMVIKKPRFWTLHSPHSYQLETRLYYVGRLVDVVTNSFKIFERNTVKSDGKPWWVTDEEREFVRRRTTHIDFIPGTPEPDAKRFYSNKERTEFVEFNYDESKAGEGMYTLEDPLTFMDGRKVKKAEDWALRRKELLKLFEREVYGRMPPKPDEMVVELVSEKLVENRIATERRYRTYFRKDKSGPVIDWVVFVPKYKSRPCPVILHLNYAGNDNIASGKTNHYKLPFEEFAVRRYAFMSAKYTQITSDAKGQEVFDGVCELWGRRDPKALDNPGALIIWAWGLCRGLDLAERISEIDAMRNVVIGSSRLGKAALLAAAFDERFRVCVPNQTGAVGVQLMKRNFGENLAGQRLSLAHWYCANVWKYAGNPASQPFDQHLLLACVAPRALLLECYHKRWFDPKGEFLSAQAASPVWELLAGKGLGLKEMPPAYSDCAVKPPFGYVRRTECHGLSQYDWKWALDFADQVFKNK